MNTYISRNPYTLKITAEYENHSLEEALLLATYTHKVQKSWRYTPYEEKAKILLSVAALLRERKEELARLITLEMGKLIGEATSEIEKCASLCEFYAVEAQYYLSERYISNASIKSFVQYEPLGVVLAIMPWNFPFWQVFRFIVPALMAGNGGILKHASNVPGCAKAIERLFIDAGLAEGLFLNLFIDSKNIEQLIASEAIAAVTLTGSEGAGIAVAKSAGSNLKKTVLELGGSDPFIILPDADLKAASVAAMKSRMINAGQSCIAAKRFIIHEAVYEEVKEYMFDYVNTLVAGDPLESNTTLAPLARPDLVITLHEQVAHSNGGNSRIIIGGQTWGDASIGYKPTLMEGFSLDSAVWREETFGPVAALIKAKNKEEMIHLANDTRFGLGATIFGGNENECLTVASELEAGSVFINEIMKSDASIPFGGIKKSGYGRELSAEGIREFCNIKSVWVK